MRGSSLVLAAGLFAAIPAQAAKIPVVCKGSSLEEMRESSGKLLSSKAEPKIARLYIVDDEARSIVLVLDKGKTSSLCALAATKCTVSIDDGRVTVEGEGPFLDPDMTVTVGFDWDRKTGQSLEKMDLRSAKTGRTLTHHWTMTCEVFDRSAADASAKPKE